MINSKVSVISSLLFKRILSDKYANKFVKKYFYKRQDIGFNDEFKSLNPIKHCLNALDGKQIYSYEIKNNILSNYIFIVNNLDYSINDTLNLINGFKEYCYNFVVINLRDIPTYGVNESLDLIEWINYYKDLYDDIKITLIGEGVGANTIIKALKFNINNVSSCILDQPHTNIKDDLLREFALNNNIKVSRSLINSVNSLLKDEFNFNLNDLSVNNCLRYNNVPLCFIHNKNNSKNNYYELLKIYNETTSIKKMFYTFVIDRNFKQENYFETLNSFIINY